MSDSGLLELTMATDAAPYWDVTTTPGGATYQNLTGYALQLVIRRRSDDALVGSWATGGSGIAIGDGLGTGSRATVTIADTAIVGWQEGTHYYGSLWRTDDGSDTEYWTGPVKLKKAAAQNG